MIKTATNVMKGAAVGIAVGTAAYMMAGKSMKPQRKKLKKGMDKAMGTLSHLVDNITYMVK